MQEILTTSIINRASMSMNTEGARRWAALTKQNVGRSIAIALDGYVYSAPRVNGEIPGGQSEISGSFTPEQTKDLANVLKSAKCRHLHVLYRKIS